MKKEILLSICLCYTAVVALTTASVAQQRLIGAVSTAEFRYDSTRSYVEFYTGIAPAGLTFTRERGQDGAAHILVAKAILDFTFTKLDNDSAWNYMDTLPIAITDTSSIKATQSIVAISKFLLLPGDYSIVLYVTDAVDSSKFDSLSSTLKVRNFPAQQLDISDIEVCSAISNGEGEGDPYLKNTLHVVPNPGSTYGLGMPRLPYYFEIYGLTDSSNITRYGISWQLKDTFGRTIKSDSSEGTGGSPDIVRVGEVDVSNVPSGKYALRITARDNECAKVAYGSRSVFVYNPYVKAKVVEDTSSIEVIGSPFYAMSEKDIDDEFSAARFLTTPQESQVYLSLKTVDSKRRFMISFWRRQGQISGEVGLVVRDKFIERMKYVNSKYGTSFKKGWLTDRGRVYLQYGKPDDIERHPSNGESKPYEIWQYNSIENGVDFVFVDMSGFNDYVLTHSTKSGEVSDPDWQKYLPSPQQ